uniref:Large ribosomal subunit protein bL17m n=1 Tax=Callorhinchus milii TaxID=7868 RepID=K4GA15_CALMI|nr:39S ribosomal protein L17, mitochondrial precursor [Callorhinchus milii]
MRVSLCLWISHGRFGRRLGLGPASRLDMLRNLVTALVRHERIETTWARADEMKVYAEKLIDYAKKGDTDDRAMKMANFWLTEKDLLPKLFRVLAPRFAARGSGYVDLHRIPNRENLDRAKMAVVEFKGNPFPPIPSGRRDSDRSLVNQLLRGYREDVQTGQAQAPVGS